MTAPIVSIVCPTWKHGKHAKVCLGSVLDQTYKSFELVMVLDGLECQDPETFAWIEANKADPRIRVLEHASNRGQAAAINTGMHAAVGTDFLTWIHNDNVYHPNWLARMVDYLSERADIDFVWTWSTKHVGGFVGNRWCCTATKPYHGYQSQSFLFRRSLLERVGDQRGDYAHDTDWFLRSQESGTWGELKEDLMIRRIHPGGVSQCQRHRDDGAKWRAEAMKRRGVTKL